jgi:1-deoxy-D-xylulose-5-phosphate reductoisomerase
MNAANEVAVDAFLNGSLKLDDIAAHVKKVMGRHTAVHTTDINALYAADAWARSQTPAITKGKTI